MGSDGCDISRVGMTGRGDHRAESAARTTAGHTGKCLVQKLFGMAKISVWESEWEVEAVTLGIDTLEDSDPDDGGFTGKLIGDIEANEVNKKVDRG